MLIRWAWSFVWGTKPPKSPRRNGTASMSSRNRVLIIVEYSPSCSWMECCYSSFSLRQEFFIRLGQSIVFGRPGWCSCGNVKKSAQQICLGAWLQQTTSQSLNQHGKVMCVPIRQRVQLLRSQQFLQDIVRTSCILFRLPKSFLFLYYIHTQKRSRAI